MRLAVLVLAACATAGPPKTWREAQPIVEPLAPPITFGPLDHVARTYDEPIEAPPPDPVATAVFDGLAAFARGRGVLARDPRLDRAAIELAPVAHAGGGLTAPVLERALHAHGVVEPAAIALAAHATEPSAILAELQPQLGERLAFGNVRIGIGGSPPVAILAYAPTVRLVGVPRFVGARDRIEVEAALDPELHAPSLTVTHDDGTVDHPPVALDDDNHLHASIACGKTAGATWLDVEDGATPEPLALVPISCGETLSPTYRVEPMANTRGKDAVHALAAIVNRERIAAGLAPVVIDPRATIAARTYATTMVRAHSVSHVLDGTPEQRMIRAGLYPPSLLESTLHADDLGDAAELLLNHAGYRANMLAPAVTHLGIGVAPDPRGGMFVAIEYAQIVPAIDIARETRAIEDVLRARDPAHILIDAPLSAIARDYAADLAVGWRSGDVWPKIVFRLKNTPHRGAEQSLDMLLDIRKLDLASLVASHRWSRAIGVGVAQSARDGALAGRIWIVVLFGY